MKRVGNVSPGLHLFLRGGNSENTAHRADHEHTTSNYSDFTVVSATGSAPSILFLSFASLYLFESSFAIFLTSQQLNLHRYYFANMPEGEGRWNSFWGSHPFLYLLVSMMVAGLEARVEMEIHYVYRHMVCKSQCVSSPMAAVVSSARSNDRGSVLEHCLLGSGESSSSCLFLSIFKAVFGVEHKMTYTSSH